MAPPPRLGGSRWPDWVRPGDVNGFLGLALDNVTQLIILSSLLIGVFKFPADLVLFRMVPGTALGVLVGDLVYTVLAVRLMRQSGRRDVTAMPFGIDTPTLFAMVFGVLGPVMMAGAYGAAAALCCLASIGAGSRREARPRGSPS